MKILDKHDLNISRASDYYSPLPILSKLEKNMQRWFKPSKLVGIQYDIEAMKNLLANLVSKYYVEYNKIPNYYENRKKGYGPGYTAFDAMILYFLIRDIKPKRYIEIGSGISTYYCSLAAEQNAKESKLLRITCIEPYPYEKLYNIQQIEIIKKEVQDVEVSAFEKLDAGDVLFIDSSHVVKIDGDVPYLYLEVIPRLKEGVIIHIHDIPFPYNVPFPPQLWVVGAKWPIFWNEAMFLQAFLYNNKAYKILLSTPLLRFYDEHFLCTNIPDYEPVSQVPNTFSSIWIKK
ncbi:MAG: class I SAM-dependent methyltransferase [Omnitrophica bacterium]|nr:class I SAM-dependent methyltransferase [Candidatus Omnitrophota bacterium]